MKKQQKYVASGLVLLLLVFGNVSNAQQKTKVDYANNPVWIKMMNDTSVNYNEAKKAFNEFWKNKEKPVEEEEIFKTAKSSKSKKDIEIKVRKAKSSDAVKYSFEYKRFLNWQREVAPYVQPDGHILNTDERIKLFEQEKKNREDAEVLNKQ